MWGEKVLIARFANLIETFATPNVGALSNVLATVGLASNQLDVKRAGIFPIVHGARSLAVEQGILVQPTVERVEALVEVGLLEPDFGKELISALHFFMELRLRSQVEAIRLGTAQNAEVSLDSLTSAERDILRDGLRVVRRLRELIRHRYHLGNL